MSMRSRITKRCTLFALDPLAPARRCLLCARACAACSAAPSKRSSSLGLLGDFTFFGGEILSCAKGSHVSMPQSTIFAPSSRSLKEQRWIGDSLGLDGRPFGSDLGFLPGDAKSKIRPYMQPMLAAVDTLLGAGVCKISASRGGSGRSM